MWPSTLRNVQRDQTACRSPAHAAGRRDPIRLRDVDGGCAKQGIAPIYGQQQKTYETVSAAAPISAVRFRHSTKSAARLPAAFKTRRNLFAAAIAARAAHGRVLDRKIAAWCPDVPSDQIEGWRSPDYHDFTMSSAFRATDQPPTRSALLTANWRGCEMLATPANITVEPTV